MKLNVFILISGSVLISVLNFYIFVILASNEISNSYAQFVVSNYLGGIYMFGFTGSVGAIILYANKQKNKLEIFSSYFFLILVFYSLFLFFAFFTEFKIGSYLCLLTALLMHINATLVNYLIVKEKPFYVKGIGISTPLIYISLLFMLSDSNFNRWLLSYFISTLISTIFYFCAFFKNSLKEQRDRIYSDIKKIIGFKKIFLNEVYKLLPRIFIMQSLSVFTQLDLITSGLIRNLPPDTYSISLRIVNSTSITIAGATSIYLFSKYKNIGKLFCSIWPYFLPIFSGLSVVSLLLINNFVGINSNLYLSDIPSFSFLSALICLASLLLFFLVVNDIKKIVLAFANGFFGYFTLIILEKFNLITIGALEPLLIFYLIFCLSIYLKKDIISNILNLNFKN